jgi:hypothetical protein
LAGTSGAQKKRFRTLKTVKKNNYKEAVDTVSEAIMELVPLMGDEDKEAAAQLVWSLQYLKLKPEYKDVSKAGW